jgi:predicted dinucleotide-binding enzyme
LIVLATLGRVVENVIDLAGPNNFTAKPVIDATNPLSDHPPVDGVLQFTTGPNESLAEKIQAKIPGAYVVKAFNLATSLPYKDEKPLTSLFGSLTLTIGGRYSPVHVM